MTTTFKPFFTILAALTIASSQLQAETPATPSEVMDTFEAIFGIHKGQRRNHIKGFCATAEFTGNKIAQQYTRSPLFSGDAIPVIARFSLPGGNPNIPDTARAPRGMALHFQLPDGGVHNIAMVNAPVFQAATPESFFAGLASKVPNPETGKPDPDKIAAYKANYPDAAIQARYLAEHNPPPSYANTTYFGIHAFKFVNANNESALIRFRFVPRDGEKEMTGEELATTPANFLQDRFAERLQNGPIQWDMIATIAQPGDTETNPTIEWPADREEINVGTLTITATSPEAIGNCSAITYDPLVLTDGIQPSADPILLMRSPIYIHALAQRTAERTERDSDQ